MTIRLHPDWAAIIRHAWTFRIAAASALIEGGEAAFEIHANGFSLWSLKSIAVAAVAAGIAFSRVVVQQAITTTVNPPAGPDAQ